GEGGAAIERGRLKSGAGGSGDVCEALAFEVAEYTIGKNRVAAEVAIEWREMGKSEEQILPSVVVEIIHTEAPAGQLTGPDEQSGALCGIVKPLGAAAIAEEEERIVDDS